MSIVSGINNNVNAIIGTGLNKFAKIPKVAKFLEKGVKDPASFAATMMVTSLISKDAVNCVIYSVQSANNKRIPEDKRGFNTWLDIINGILNVGGQLVSYYIVDSIFTPKWFGKSYSGTFKDPHTKVTSDLADKYGLASTTKSQFRDDHIRGIVEDTLNSIKDGKAVEKNNPFYNLINKIKDSINVKFNKETLSKMSSEEIGKVVTEVTEQFKAGSSKYNSIEKGFALVVGALATTALVKRTLVPLISTPLAGKLSDMRAQKKKDEEKEKAEANIVNTINDPASKLQNNQLDKVA